MSKRTIDYSRPRVGSRVIILQGAAEIIGHVATVDEIREGPLGQKHLVLTVDGVSGDYRSNEDWVRIAKW